MKYLFVLLLLGSTIDFSLRVDLASHSPSGSISPDVLEQMKQDKVRAFPTMSIVNDRFEKSTKCQAPGRPSTST